MSSECEYIFTYKTVKAYKNFEDYIIEILSQNSYNKKKSKIIEEGYLISKRYIEYWK